MEKIELRPISEEEFYSWKVESQKNYAKEKEKAGLSEEEAVALAEKSFSTLLPDREKTREQYLFTVVEISTGAAIGTLWWGLQKQGKDLLPWIYDIVLNESARGKGYGRAAMTAAERSVKEHGFHRLGLHVFGHNQVARNLYDSMGFRTTSIVMQKDF